MSIYAAAEKTILTSAGKVSKKLVDENGFFGILKAMKEAVEQNKTDVFQKAGEEAPGAIKRFITSVRLYMHKLGFFKLPEKYVKEMNPENFFGRIMKRLNGKADTGKLQKFTPDLEDAQKALDKEKGIERVHYRDVNLGNTYEVQMNNQGQVIRLDVKKQVKNARANGFAESRSVTHSEDGVITSTRKFQVGDNVIDYTKKNGYVAGAELRNGQGAVQETMTTAGGKRAFNSAEWDNTSDKITEMHAKAANKPVPAKVVRTEAAGTQAAGSQAKETAAPVTNNAADGAKAAAQETATTPGKGADASAAPQGAAQTATGTGTPAADAAKGAANAGTGDNIVISDSGSGTVH